MRLYLFFLPLVRFRFSFADRLVACHPAASSGCLNCEVVRREIQRSLLSYTTVVVARLIEIYDRRCFVSSMHHFCISRRFKRHPRKHVDRRNVWFLVFLYVCLKRILTLYRFFCRKVNYANGISPLRSIGRRASKDRIQRVFKNPSCSILESRFVGLKVEV